MGTVGLSRWDSRSSRVILLSLCNTGSKNGGNMHEREREREGAGGRQGSENRRRGYVGLRIQRRQRNGRQSESELRLE